MSDLILSPEDLLTELGVVNVLIGSLGESPLDSLDGTNSDASQALATLSLINTLVQARGWSWNRLYGTLLPLANDGTIPVPEGTLEVVKAYISITGSNPPEPFKVVLRDDHLWDLYGNTAIFTAPLYCDLIVQQPWSGIPAPFRLWIALRAAQRFHAANQERQILLQVNAQDIRDASVTCEQREDEAQRFNTIKGNPNMFTKLWGLGGLRRNRQGT